MTKLNLKPVDVVNTITKEDFINNYYKPQKPVVIKNLIDNWPAKEKWNFEYMKQIAGDRIVPLYDDRPVDYKDNFNSHHAEMKMSEYIDLLQREPTRYRIFLYNIIKEIPSLKKDFSYPDIGLKFLKSLPMLFFGGTDSYTFMHYDIDLANIFHFHFQGKKTCILFPPSETKYLYKIPFSLISREDIDYSNPDLEKWPALAKAKGMVANLEHGNVLYMPEGYWHYMKYNTAGFSMSFRALAKKPSNFSKAVYNVFLMRYIDNFMRKIKGEKWLNYKLNRAIVNTHKNLINA
ncbi:cupin-like domain-containing protein [Lutibacter sp. B1]|uniref:cupin-like domain-containing protein n=1 Tax=Lutibacter sp. B1 TaxID=2725996 RepID=UPI001456D97D|nr:cupin-like domain-containing protein [Lutibacter sp. B1]NLP59092.1 cupin-like domain-containing protein [Lutibacter sp. B1]